MKFENQQLECVLYIKYLVKFKKDHTEIQALIDFGNKANAMTPAYTPILELRICSTNVGTQKINKSILLTYSMVLSNF